MNTSEGVKGLLAKNRQLRKSVYNVLKESKTNIPKKEAKHLTFASAALATKFTKPNKEAVKINKHTVASMEHAKHDELYFYHEPPPPPTSPPPSPPTSPPHLNQFKTAPKMNKPFTLYQKT